MKLKPIQEGTEMHRFGHPADTLEVLAVDSFMAMVRLGCGQRRFFPLHDLERRWVVNQPTTTLPPSDRLCGICMIRPIYGADRICGPCARKGER